MDPNRAPTEPDAYAAWINRRIGAEVRRRREALGLSAYALAKSGEVTDQTILNIEQGNAGSLTSTLARICVRFRTTLTELVTAADLVADHINNAANPTGVSTLGLAVSDPPTQAEVQALAGKLDLLIAALRREP